MEQSRTMAGRLDFWSNRGRLRGVSTFGAVADDCGASRLLERSRTIAGRLDFWSGRGRSSSRTRQLSRPRRRLAALAAAASPRPVRTMQAAARGGSSSSRGRQLGTRPSVENSARRSRVQRPVPPQDRQDDDFREAHRAARIVRSDESARVSEARISHARAQRDSVPSRRCGGSSVSSPEFCSLRVSWRFGVCGALSSRSQGRQHLGVRRRRTRKRPSASCESRGTSSGRRVGW